MGNQFAFELDVTKDVTTFFGTLEDTRMVFNRTGSIQGVVPEAATAALVSVAGLVAVCIGAGIRLRKWGARLLILALASFECASLSEAADDLAQQLTEQLKRMECPGALVAIQQGANEPLVHVLGVADVKTESPMQRGMHMRIGSVSKLFLGTLVLRLADEGKLSLDDPISKYVEGVPQGDKISLRSLGNNTSGLFNSIENKTFQQAIVAQPEREWKPAEILSYAFDQPAYGAPGEKWRYSNSNAILLGLAVEKATGKSLAEAMREFVLNPLQLKHCDFPEDGKLPSPAPSAYRNGYKDKVIGYGKVFYDVTNYSAAWTGAAGNMYGTLDDLLVATKPLATGSLLSESARKELHRWVDTPLANTKYGFCIGKQEAAIGHTGDVPGFQAVATFDPDRDLTVVVLTNLSNNKDGTMPAEQLAKTVSKQFTPSK